MNKIIKANKIRQSDHLHLFMNSLLKGVFLEWLDSNYELFNLKGNPLQVVKIVDCCSEVDENALSSILLDTRVRDNKVMVVSVVGVNEKERSLFLNSFLKFLNSSAVSHKLFVCFYVIKKLNQ